MAELSAATLSRLTVLNTGLLAVNTLILAGLLLRGGEAPATAASPDSVLSAPQTVAPPSMSSGSPRPMNSAPDGPTLEGIQGFIEATVSPLADAAQDHGAGDILPTEEEIAAAVKTDSLESPETLAVLETLKAGYAKFNMPFPEIKIPGPPSAEPDEGVPSTSRRDDSAQIESWATPTIDKLRGALAEKGESEAGLIPTEAELAAAVASGRMDSEETRWIIDKLKNGYARLDLPFPEPGSVSGPGPSSSAPSSSDSSASNGEQKVLEAYFEANIQRLELMASKQGIDVSGVLPDAEVVRAAVASGDIASDAAQPALEQLRTGYDRVGLKFREPVVNP
ncbi:MAG: hypothetical protein P8R54_10925 [Myxococcota bacterium]|nr:hypothetical protein [Myxococcota bacterium]